MRKLRFVFMDYDFDELDREAEMRGKQTVT